MIHLFDMSEGCRFSILSVPWRRLCLLALSALLIMACGGDSDGGGNAATPGGGNQTQASCGPAGSGIASVPRDQQRSFRSAPERVVDPAKTYVVTMRTARGQ